MKRYVRESRDDACVGIWWYTDEGQVIGVYKSLDDEFNDGTYLQYSDKDNHMTLWRTVLQDNISDDVRRNELYQLGYKGIERGRVIYNLKTQCFEVICSEAIYNDLSARKSIKSAYGLNSCRVDFEHLSHYSKLPLTGNPSVDAMNYEY